MLGNIAQNNFPKAISVLLSLCSECLQGIQNEILSRGFLIFGKIKMSC
jgi:hypothetical protein